MNFTRTNMVIARSAAFVFRTFIRDTDDAAEFAAWLRLNGWAVEIREDVEEANSRHPAEAHLSSIVASHFFNNVVGRKA